MKTCAVQQDWRPRIRRDLIRTNTLEQCTIRAPAELLSKRGTRKGSSRHLAGCTGVSIATSPRSANRYTNTDFTLMPGRLKWLHMGASRELSGARLASSAGQSALVHACRPRQAEQPRELLACGYRFR